LGAGASIKLLRLSGQMVVNTSSIFKGARNFFNALIDSSDVYSSVGSLPDLDFHSDYIFPRDQDEWKTNWSRHRGSYRWRT